MSIAALQTPATVYREEQSFDWWSYVLLGIIMILGVAGFSRPRGDGGGLTGAGWNVLASVVPALGLAIPPILIVGVLHMTTEVVPGRCSVWFGWLPTVRRSLDLGQVTRVEIVQFRLWRDFWGPGIRAFRGGKKAMTARGSRGVRLVLGDGSSLVIGSQNPEALAIAIEHAMRPAGC